MIPTCLICVRQTAYLAPSTEVTDSSLIEHLCDCLCCSRWLSGLAFRTNRLSSFKRKREVTPRFPRLINESVGGFSEKPCSAASRQCFFKFAFFDPLDSRPTKDHHQSSQAVGGSDLRQTGGVPVKRDVCLVRVKQRHGGTALRSVRQC